jgi:hypothetical protein
MPKKDPITGCMVMTFGEFWAAEDERAGAEPGTAFENFLAAEAEAERADSQRLFNPQVAFEILNAAIEEWSWGCEEEDHITPITCVLRVYEAHATGSFRSSKTRLVAMVENVDGERGLIEMDSDHWFGTFYEPPDSDLNLRWYKKENN